MERLLLEQRKLLKVMKDACNDCCSFVETINKLVSSHDCAGFYQEARDLFLHKYSYEASFDFFSKWLMSIG